MKPITVRDLIAELLQLDMDARVCVDSLNRIVWVTGAEKYPNYTGNAVHMVLSSPVVDEIDLPTEA